MKIFVLSNFRVFVINPLIERYWHDEKTLGRQTGQWPLLHKAQFIEIKIFLSNYLLSSQGDRVSMANSVEGRYPFLDHNLIEFCCGLPPSLKLKGLREKHLLKKTFRDVIPPEVVNRDKHPYRAPYSKASSVKMHLPLWGNSFRKNKCGKKDTLRLMP